MTLLNTVNIGGTDFGLANNSVLGTCATPAGSEVKVCTFGDSFELKAGLNVAVKFTYANTYGDGSTTYPKLSVNGTSYPIKRSNDSYVRSGDWANGQTAVFMFNGTDFIFTNNTTNILSMSDTTAIASSAIAAALQTNSFRLFTLAGDGQQKTLRIRNNSSLGNSVMTFLICSRYSVTLIHIEVDTNGNYFSLKTNVLAKRSTEEVTVAYTAKEITFTDGIAWQSMLVLAITPRGEVVNNLAFTLEV